MERNVVSAGRVCNSGEVRKSKKKSQSATGRTGRRKAPRRDGTLDVWNGLHASGKQWLPQTGKSKEWSCGGVKQPRQVISKTLTKTASERKQMRGVRIVDSTQYISHMNMFACISAFTMLMMHVTSGSYSSLWPKSETRRHALSMSVGRCGWSRREQRQQSAPVLGKIDAGSV